MNILWKGCNYFNGKIHKIVERIRVQTQIQEGFVFFTICMNFRKANLLISTKSCVRVQLWPKKEKNTLDFGADLDPGFFFNMAR